MHKLPLLHIEDSSDYSLVFKLKAQKHFSITLCTSIAEVKNLSNETLSAFKIVICDGQLPDGTGMDALGYLKNKADLVCVGNSSSDEYNLMMSPFCKYVFNKKDLLKDPEIINKCLNLASN